MNQRWLPSCILELRCVGPKHYLDLSLICPSIPVLSLDGKSSTSTGFLKRRKVWNAVDKVLNEAPVVSSKKVLEHLASEELMLCKFLGAVLVAMGSQRCPRDIQRGNKNSFRLFAGNTHHELLRSNRR